MQLLRRIFRSYRSHGLLISPKKTKLFRRAVDFLSVKVSEDGLFPTDEGTEKVMAWPRPVKPKDVAAFTGFVQYYAHFLPDFSELCAPLNKVKSKKKLIWTEEMEDSFNKIKEAFREVSGRRHLVLDKETMTYPGLILQVDFSKNAVAAVLHQQTEQGERFIAARTKTLKPYEKRYCSTKGELLALVHGLDKFAHVLACQRFTVVSDNLGVTNVTTAKLGNNAVLSRWLDTLSKFDFDVLHRPGKELIPADTLSRLIMRDTEDYVPVNDEEESAINQLEEEDVDMVSEQWKDRDLRKLMKMMMAGNVSYFDGEENKADNIRTLVELARRQELLVVKSEDGRSMLVKKASIANRSEEHTSELQSLTNLVCRLLLEKKKTKKQNKQKKKKKQNKEPKTRLTVKT